VTVLPIGAVAGEFAVSKLGAGEPSSTVGGLAGGSTAQGAAGGAGLTGVEGTSGLQGTSGVEGPGGVEGAAGAEATGGAGASAGSEGGGGFGEALTGAISSLEQTQTSASSAAQGLATGTVSDPESAVVTVEEAQLAMQLASQIRTKATEAVQTIFQTQV
jgi:flagellar hook-basal body complex protein FliE